MADLAVARQQFPELVREHVTVVFVSEDPERDTPEVLRQWLDQFDSTGSTPRNSFAWPRPRHSISSPLRLLGGRGVRPGWWRG
ncbi:MAG: SCO family protein [Geodermatophilaceae bacterium]|nr:SCO family protein [Geodermatophilaceae bacterium]